MAATLTVDKEVQLNGARIVMAHGNLGTYATGGIAVTPRAVRLGQIDTIVPNNAGDYRFEYDRTNVKLKAYTDDAVTGISAEVANTTDLSAITLSMLIFGSY